MQLFTFRAMQPSRACVACILHCMPLILSCSLLSNDGLQHGLHDVTQGLQALMQGLHELQLDVKKPIGLIGDNPADGIASSSSSTAGGA